MISPKGPVTFATEWQKSEPKPVSLNIKLIPYTALAFPVGNWKIIYRNPITKLSSHFQDQASYLRIVRKFLFLWTSETKDIFVMN